MAVQQGGFQEPSCSSVAGAGSFIHPTETFGSTKPICSQSPNSPSRADMNTQQQPQELLVENFLTSLTFMLILHPHCFPFLATSAYWIGQPILLSWVNPWHFGGIFTLLSFLLHYHPQIGRYLNLPLSPKDPTINSLVGTTTSTIRELLFWSNREGCWEGEEKGRSGKELCRQFHF